MHLQQGVRVSELRSSVGAKQLTGEQLADCIARAQWSGHEPGPQPLPLTLAAAQTALRVHHSVRPSLPAASH